MTPRKTSYATNGKTAETLPDLSGEVFNRWTVLKFVGVNSKGPGVRLWLCRCSCGTEKVMGIDNLRRGMSKSCGCLQAETRREPRGLMPWLCKPQGVARRNAVAYSYKKKGCKLSDEQLDVLFGGNCYYCGVEPSMCSKSSYSPRTGVFIYNGIDRVDNTKGYEIGNVVSCCKMCNIAKNNHPYSEFVAWAERLHANLVATSQVPALRQFPPFEDVMGIKPPPR